jgi:hypothetical protein
LKRKLAVGSVVTLVVAALFTLAAFASDAQMYFSSDRNGQNRVTNIQEGDEIFIVVIDNDENIDCDIRDKFTTDVKIMDPKTGAYIIWEKVASFNPEDPDGDYFEETGADTGVFVSSRPFQVGTRESYTVGAAPNDYEKFTHVVDSNGDDFQWGHYMYVPITNDGVQDYADDRGWLDDAKAWQGGLMAAGLTWAAGELGDGVLPHGSPDTEDYTVGRFENMDSLIGMYQDPNDATDVATAMMKIIDTEATIAWDQEVYKDANGAATITVVDPDENLNCNEVEYVPVFILINPGSWNLNQTASITANSFCGLERDGGYLTAVADQYAAAAAIDKPIRWYNIYEDRYIRYPTEGVHALATYKTLFDVDVDKWAAGGIGYSKVVFFAEETGVDTGVFELPLNSILTELGFDSLNVRDVLVAYYLDPNDFDDFKLATAYIEERQHSITSFTDANRADKDLYWIGRDPVYVQVIDSNANVDPCCPEQVVVHLCDPHGEDDSEWIILDETSSNSPVFFTFAGTQLWPVWDALGVGLADSVGGWLLQLDNWKLEVFNEDDVYARYNDVYYETGTTGMGGLGDVTADSTASTAFPPAIDRVRVFNDVSFDLMSIADTQVYDGATTQMYFLDRQGNRVSGYVNSDCVFVEVLDPDQDEDQYRRERIDGYWDGGQNVPFGPQAINEFVCEDQTDYRHFINCLLGDTNIFNDEPAGSLTGYYGDDCDDAGPPTSTSHAGWAKLYVLNPRSGNWAALDLLETGVATGDFVSVICIDLVSVYSDCVPTLGVLPGDTIVAFYQDPSNHSDSAMISIKVGIGGGGTPPTQASTTMFVDADGNEVANYTDADTVYVKVIDPSHTGAATLANAVEIDGETYDLTLIAGDEFMTEGLDLDLVAGDEITATYTDPTDPTDESSATITIIASVLDVVEFYAAPNPFDGECTFGYSGTGIASVMSVDIYDLTGTLVWSSELTDVTEIVWDGTDATGASLANGCYIYVIYATDGTNAFTDKGKVFINR